MYKYKKYCFLPFVIVVCISCSNQYGTGYSAAVNSYVSEYYKLSGLVIQEVKIERINEEDYCRIKVAADNSVSEYSNVYHGTPYDRLDNGLYETYCKEHGDTGYQLTYHCTDAEPSPKPSYPIRDFSKIELTSNGKHLNEFARLVSISSGPYVSSQYSKFNYEEYKASPFFKSVFEVKGESPLYPLDVFLNEVKKGELSLLGSGYDRALFYLFVPLSMCEDGLEVIAVDTEGMSYSAFSDLESI